MRIWVYGEVCCSGKRSEIRPCDNTFEAKIQIKMSHSSISTIQGKPNVIMGIDGHPPEGWFTSKKEYYSAPFYFCPECKEYFDDFESRPI